MYSEQVQKDLIERLRKRTECFDYDARPDIATDYEMAADVIEELKEKYDNSRESTKRLMEQLAKVEKWIDCKEKLPEIGRRVIVMDKGGLILTGCYIDYDDGEDGRWIIDGEEDYNVMEITAWMYLPAPPAWLRRD